MTSSTCEENDDDRFGLTRWSAGGSASLGCSGTAGQERRQADTHEARIADLQQFAAVNADGVPMRRALHRVLLARWDSRRENCNVKRTIDNKARKIKSAVIFR